MSEGELKKRLLPFAYQLDGEFTLSTDPKTFVDDFNDIIDEAKKEFLIMWVANVPPDSIVQVTGEDYVKSFKVFEDWFTKWFGSSQVAGDSDK